MDSIDIYSIVNTVTVLSTNIYSLRNMSVAPLSELSFKNDQLEELNSQLWIL
jgi:hypothetical protein